MTEKEWTSKTLYAEAYRLHYDEADIELAEGYYCELLNRFPGAEEADWARSQLENIKIMTLSRREYLKRKQNREAETIEAVNDPYVCHVPQAGSQSSPTNRERIETSSWLSESKYMGQLSVYQRRCVFVGIVALIALLVFPPHVGHMIVKEGDNVRSPIGHYLIFNAPLSKDICSSMQKMGIVTLENCDRNSSYKTFTADIDVNRLLIEFLILFGILGVLFIVCGSSDTKIH